LEELIQKSPGTLYSCNPLQRPFLDLPRENR
jgi:hypothetical protein